MKYKTGDKIPLGNYDSICVHAIGHDDGYEFYLFRYLKNQDVVSFGKTLFNRIGYGIIGTFLFICYAYPCGMRSNVR